MRTLLFGGTFDPPHIGHMALLDHAIEAAGPGRVIVMPAGIPPHKEAAETPPDLRFAMCGCFLPLFPNMQISDMELRREGKSYTLHTVRALLEQYPEDEFYLSIGGDMLLGFAAWHRYEELLQEVCLVVQARQEGQAALREAAAALAEKGGRVLWARGETPAVSSSEIRARIAEGEDMSRFLPPPVDALVREHGLYRRACLP